MMEGDNYYWLEQNCFQKSHGTAGAFTKQAKPIRGGCASRALGCEYIPYLSEHLLASARPSSVTCFCQVLGERALCDVTP